MLLRFDGVLMLPKHLTDNFRPLHRDGKSTAFSKMIRTGVVRPVRLHHCDGADVETARSLRSRFAELTHKGNGVLGFHAFGVLRERLCGDAATSSFKTRLV